MKGTLLLLPIGLAVMACHKDAGRTGAAAEEVFPMVLPAGFPPLPVPDDNPLTTASVQLGKALFFEPRLSRDGSIACSSCHRPELAFSDGLPKSVGIEGRLGQRNTPSLGNVAYHPKLFRDGGLPSLEMQALSPILEAHEMDHDVHAAAALLRDEPPYAELSRRAYDRPLDAWVITRALASYQRTLVSGWSRWDRWMQGDSTALTASEKRGRALFNSSALNCGACHSGFDLSDHGYHNIGLYAEYADPGRGRITLDPADEGKFKTPGLRNVARTAPYMHDGSVATLEEVLDHFASGGRPHANRDAAMRTFVLDEGQKADLIAFLHALTDERTMDPLP